MDSVPAVMAELLDDIVPLRKIPEMRAWKTHAYDAILEMTKGVEIKTSCAVERVHFVRQGDPSAVSTDRTRGRGSD